MLRRRGQQAIKPIRSIVLGKDGVGKSALVVRFLTRRFIGEYDQSLEQTYRHHVEVDNEDIPLDISDTAGENTDEKLRQSCRQGDLFFVLYSITDRSSFEEAIRIGRFVKECRNVDSMAIVIVATKCDLDHFRKVEFEEGSDLSTELDCTFHEVSTSEDYSQVHEVVQSSLRSFVRDRLKRETGGLKVPSLVKKSPSFEKKKRSARNSHENSKAAVRPFEIRPRMRRKEEGDGSVTDDKLNNNVLNVDAKRNETISVTAPSIRVNGVAKHHKKQGPFNLENVKNASSRDRNKLPLPSGNSLDSSPRDKPKIPFIVHKVKGSSASEWMRPLPIDKLRAPTSNYWTEESVSEGKPKQSSKGPFSIDRLRSQSTEKLRTSSPNDRARSTSSFTRMKDGLIGRTKSLRRKPIYL